MRMHGSDFQGFIVGGGFSFHFSLAPHAEWLYTHHTHPYRNVKMRIDLLFGSIKLDPWQFCFCTLHFSILLHHFSGFLSLIACALPFAISPSHLRQLQFYFPSMYTLYVWVCGCVLPLRLIKYKPELKAEIKISMASCACSNSNNIDIESSFWHWTHSVF